MKTLKGIFNGLVKRSDVTNPVHKNEVNLTSHQQVLGSSETFYQCPMKCEGEKTYNTPGNCPVCNMKLVQVSDSGSTSLEHEHEGHGHHGCC